MIGEQIAALRAQARLQRGNERNLSPRIAAVERELLDRRQTLYPFRELMRNHADKPFERFERAMDDARRACARTGWLEALDSMATAAAVLDSIDRRIGIHRQLDEQDGRCRAAIAAVRKAGTGLLAMPSLAEPAMLRAAAEQALMEGLEGRAKLLAAMHLSLLERWSGHGTSGGLRALAVVAGLPSPSVPWRRLPTPVVQALEALKAKGFVGLAGALALDVLAQSDGWRVHDRTPLAAAGEQLDETLRWVRDRLGKSVHSAKES